MLKFLIALVVVLALIAFGDKTFSLSTSDHLALIIPAIWIAFLARLYISQR